MVKNKELLDLLLTNTSPSGREIAMQKILMNYMKDHSDKIITDNIGNIYATVNPDSNYKILLDAHIDEVGYTVTDVTSDGFVKVSRNGGPVVKAALCQRVNVFTKKGILKGTFGLSHNADGTVSEIKTNKDLYLDLGFTSKEQAWEYLTIGDPVAFDVTYDLILNDRIMSRALDDKIGIYIVMEVARRLYESRTTKNGVYSLAAVGEETTGRGAYYAANNIKPNLAISIDVTFANDYGNRSTIDGGFVELDKGPVICLGSLLNDKINKRLEKVAEANNIKVQYELSNSSTYTNLDVIYKQNGGIPTALVSIPLRYMHTASEIGSMKDVEEIIVLLTKFIEDIDENFNLDPFSED